MLLQEWMIHPWSDLSETTPTYFSTSGATSIWIIFLLITSWVGGHNSFSLSSAPLGVIPENFLIHSITLHYTNQTIVDHIGRTCIGLPIKFIYDRFVSYSVFDWTDCFIPMIEKKVMIFLDVIRWHWVFVTLYLTDTLGSMMILFINTTSFKLKFAVSLRSGKDRSLLVSNLNRCEEHDIFITS